MTAPIAPRVLMLLENNPFPQDVRVRQEAKALVTAGYEVSVICPSAKGQKWIDTVDGVTVYRYPAPPSINRMMGYLLEYGYSMVAIFGLSLWVAIRQGIDIVHAHCPPDLFVFMGIFYKAFGKRFVYDHHDLAPELYSTRFSGKPKGLFYNVLIWLEKLSCRFADCVIATNQSYKQVEMERGRVPEERIVIVRNGPDLDQLGQTDPATRNRFNGITAVVYAGVMGYQDGLDYLLRALACLRDDLGRADFVCTLVGDGDASKSLDALVAQLSLANHVVFTGWVTPSEVVQYLSAADICVAPEPDDAYNNLSTAIKLMEYMAMSKPIVAFDLREHRITAQEAALYARPNDEFDFARKIADLIDDPNLRHRLGRSGRFRVETQYAWHHQERHLLKAYAGISS